MVKNFMKINDACLYGENPKRCKKCKKRMRLTEDGTLKCLRCRYGRTGPKLSTPLTL